MRGADGRIVYETGWRTAMRPTLGSVGGAIRFLFRVGASPRDGGGSTRLMVAVVFLEIFGEEGPVLVGVRAVAIADGWAATATGFGAAGGDARAAASVVATEVAVGSRGQNDGRAGVFWRRGRAAHLGEKMRLWCRARSGSGSGRRTTRVTRKRKVPRANPDPQRRGRNGKRVRLQPGGHVI